MWLPIAQTAGVFYEDGKWIKAEVLNKVMIESGFITIKFYLQYNFWSKKLYTIQDFFYSYSEFSSSDSSKVTHVHAYVRQNFLNLLILNKLIVY